MLIKTPYVSIKPNYITTYIRYDQTGDSATYEKTFAPIPVSNLSEGLMSAKANKRVRLAIDWLLHITKDKTLSKKGIATNFKFKVNFITLTLSSKQKHSDNEIKKVMLNQFLTELRQKYGCKNYIWRAESQSNGNIHFHVCSDVFVPWRSLRTDWNRIQEKLGYISRFTEKTGKVDPNSTDVHSINNIKNLPAYLAKYCSKNSKGYVVMATRATVEPFRPKNIMLYRHPKFNPKAKFFRQIHGKLWGLSQDLSRLQAAKMEIIDGVETELRWLERKKPEKIKYFEKAAIMAISVKELIEKKCETLVSRFNQYVDEVLNPKPKPIIEMIRKVILPPPKPKPIQYQLF